MEKIKKFLLDDSGTAEATTVIIFIAAAGILLAAGLVIYCRGANSFFTSAGGAMDAYAAKIPH